MGDFFHGWRRKIGVLTLVVALLFLFGWVRSSSIRDSYWIDLGARGELHIASQRDLLSFIRQKQVSSRYRRVVLLGDNRAHEFPEFEWRSHWEQLEFRIGTGLMIQERDGSDIDWNILTIHSDVFDVSCVQAPYWSIVLPLTLISAYLLLVKPRMPKSQTPVDGI